MNRFPIVIKEVNDGVKNERYVKLATSKDIKRNDVRKKCINDYCKKELSTYGNASNLCFSCDNASPLKCKKISDIAMDLIFNYQFITDGFQVQDPYYNYSDDEESLDLSNDYESESRHNSFRIVKFKVTGCKNYKSSRIK